MTELYIIKTFQFVDHHIIYRQTDSHPYLV